ncbi:MAG: GrpE protein [Oscillospiraceae bacterium]|nr:GrpE protein [Oscillospiraceae bacterium]
MSKSKSKKEDIKENETTEEIVEETVQGNEEQTGQENLDPIKALEEENAGLKDKLLRQMAEFENFRKRTAKEKQELFADATVSCLGDIIGVIDNFERALEYESSDSEFKKGVEMIFNQFKDSLTKIGVTEIEAMGNPFDPRLHNAVNQIEDENFGENTVCQVFQKGYLLGEKVIRHAMVVVANP